MTDHAVPESAARRQPPTRSDAVANQERLLAAAVAAMLRDGRQVPMSSIARDAGVGIGTLYRNYPTRESLLAALTERSFQLVLNVVEDASAVKGPAIEAIGTFLTLTIDHRNQLVLPLHGGPQALTEQAQNLRDKIQAGISEILDRGHTDRTIRADVTSSDIVFFGALLAQPLSEDESWLARNLDRQMRLFLSGLAPAAPGLDAA